MALAKDKYPDAVGSNWIDSAAFFSASFQRPAAMNDLAAIKKSELDGFSMLKKQFAASLYCSILA